MYSIELNDAEMSAALDRLSARLSDMTPLMQDLGELLVVSTQERVQAGMQPDGQPFAPRSQTTLDRYAELGLSFGQPLNQSGEMRGGVFYQAGSDSVEIGSNAIQAAVMQFGAEQGAFGETARGGPIPWGDIPARPWLGISDDDRTNILAEIEDWLTGAVDGDP